MIRQIAALHRAPFIASNPTANRSEPRMIRSNASMSRERGKGAGVDETSGLVKTLRAERRRRLDLDEPDHIRLEAAAQRFGLPKSEVVRRLIRAATDLGPALSKDNCAVVGALAREVRAVARGLGQLGQSIRRGEAASLAEAEGIISRLVASYAAINGELAQLTPAYGSRVRDRIAQPDVEG